MESDFLFYVTLCECREATFAFFVVDLWEGIYFSFRSFTYVWFTSKLGLVVLSVPFGGLLLVWIKIVVPEFRTCLGLLFYLWLLACS